MMEDTTFVVRIFNRPLYFMWLRMARAGGGLERQRGLLKEVDDRVGVAVNCHGRQQVRAEPFLAEAPMS